MSSYDKNIKYSIAKGVDPLNPPEGPSDVDEDSDSGHEYKMYSDCDNFDYDTGSDYMADEVVPVKERAHERYMEAAVLANTAIVALKKRDGATEQEIIDYLRSKHGDEDLNDRFPNGEEVTWDTYVAEYLFWANINGTLTGKLKGYINPYAKKSKITKKNTLKNAKLSKELILKEEIARVAKDNANSKKVPATSRPKKSKVVKRK